MLFNSWPFLIFFVTVFTLYYTVASRCRWQLLLAASCIFYMAYVPKYIFILFTTIVTDYLAALIIAQSQGRIRTLYLYLSVIVTCLILFYFKYFDFFATNVVALAQMIGWNYSLVSLQVLLPIGLSFHTFQSLSYVIEVYRGNQKPERHFGIYALYVMFFPQLVAGPIERPQNLLHQFHKHVYISYEELSSGAKLVAWGLFKKVVVADRLALFVNPVYQNPGAANFTSVVVAFFFFYFQIYADFSGYSDIARGTARLLGIDLMRNFNLPYLARSMTEFWKRWHISLSTWLRDYIYEPLALSLRNHGHLGILLALIITFFISGLWHGAKWTFVFWGCFHGFLLTAEYISARFFKIKKRVSSRVASVFGLVSTFLLVCISYVFFRASTFHDAFILFGKIAKGLAALLFHNFIPRFAGSHVFAHGSTIDAYGYEFIISLYAIALMVMIEILHDRGLLQRYLKRLPYAARIVLYQFFVVLLVIYGTWLSEANPFIYFQF